jgi:hypothetical protein
MRNTVRGGLYKNGAASRAAGPDIEWSQWGCRAEQKSAMVGAIVRKGKKNEIRHKRTHTMATLFLDGHLAHRRRERAAAAGLRQPGVAHAERVADHPLAWVTDVVRAALLGRQGRVDERI